MTTKTYTLFRSIHSIADYKTAKERLEKFYQRAGIHPDDLLQLLSLQDEVKAWERHYSTASGASSTAWKRMALLTDIHGNLAGLRAVLQDAEQQGCDRFFCLGDLIDGGNEDAEVIALIREKKITCVRGNHDEWCPPDIGDTFAGFLENLPEDRYEEDMLFTHISPRQEKRPVRTDVEAWNVFNETTSRLIFIGHLHFPALYGEKSTISCQSTLHDFQYGCPFQLDPGNRYIICPGPVGYSRDGVEKIRYAIFDRQTQSIEMRQCDGPLLSLYK